MTIIITSILSHMKIYIFINKLDRTSTFHVTLARLIRKAFRYLESCWQSLSVPTECLLSDQGRKNLQPIFSLSPRQVQMMTRKFSFGGRKRSFVQSSWPQSKLPTMRTLRLIFFFILFFFFYREVLQIQRHRHGQQWLVFGATYRCTWVRAACVVCWTNKHGFCELILDSPSHV